MKRVGGPLGDIGPAWQDGLAAPEATISGRGRSEHRRAGEPPHLPGEGTHREAPTRCRGGWSIFDNLIGRRVSGVKSAGHRRHRG